MTKAAAILRSRTEDLARLMALEMGKPVRQGRAEVEKCAWVCDYYAERAAGFLEPETVATEARRSFVTYRPLGVVLAVMPWNFPFWQVFRFAAPALMAGNAGVLKHASNVCGCALAIEDVFSAAGFPRGVFRTLLVGSGAVESIISHPAVRAVTLTGSAAAGRAVARAAGEQLKKTVLELGGSDPYVVLDDADVGTGRGDLRREQAHQRGTELHRGEEVHRGRVEGSRVHRAARGGDAERSRSATRSTKRPTSGRSRGSICGTKFTARSWRASKGARGAFSAAGCPAGRGAYYPPTVLVDVAKGMSACDDELFGPVAAVIAVRDEEEAIRAANDTSFGLGAALFTRDLERGERIAASRIDAGSCFVNAFVKSDPRLPFGGVKESGYGRELSYFGIREFVNVKTVYVA